MLNSIIFLIFNYIHKYNSFLTSAKMLKYFFSLHEMKWLGRKTATYTTLIINIIVIVTFPYVLNYKSDEFKY